MRFIDTEYLDFAPVHFEVPDHESQGASLKYAVLSHRWYSRGEANFANFSSNKGPQLGMKKIEKFCEITRKKGIRLGWADTVCIDKSSSAELTESINGMWRLYKYARLCIVYLHDVSISSLADIPTEGDAYSNNRTRDSSVPRDQAHLRPVNQRARATSDPGVRNDDIVKYVPLHESEWFRRGWTLQELLAPSEMEFYDTDWNYLGTRKDLELFIEKATGIRHADKPDVLKNASVAQRMAWAARREVTRDEDIAYCLIGLFNVSLPVVYGEGGRMAFYRLQLEILKEYDDESIFAWDQDRDSISGMLAVSPKAFANCSDIVRSNVYGYNRPFSMTNKGLKFHCLAEIFKEHSEDRKKSFLKRVFEHRATKYSYEVPLNCRRKGSSGKGLNLAVTLIGFQNDPRVCRQGRVKNTRISIDSIRTNVDNYYDWFHDFNVPQDVEWAFDPLDAYRKGREGPETFDTVEKWLLAAHTRREIERNAPAQVPPGTENSTNKT